MVPEHQPANAHEGDGDEQAGFLPTRQTFWSDVVARRQKLPKREPGVKPSHGDGHEQQAAHDAEREVAHARVEFWGTDHNIDQARNEDDQQDAGPDALMFCKAHRGGRVVEVLITLAKAELPSKEIPVNSNTKNELCL